MMYSQYSYYQSSSPQQSQQPQITTTTSGQVWNGQQWIAAAVPAPAPSYTQPAATATAAATPYAHHQPPAPPAPPAHPPPPAVIKHGKTHSQLVGHYTSHYHGWTAQSTSAKAALASLPPPHAGTPSNNARREEMERREKWASYYASNSAACAHYHLAMGRCGAEPYARPASPPAPPQVADGAGESDAAASASAAVTSVGVAASGASGESAKNNAAVKKKSRWASTGGEDENNHGKSSTAAVTAATAASVEKNTSSKSNGLYLNKFVQEKTLSNGIGKLEDAAYESRKNSISNANQFAREKATAKWEDAAREPQKSVAAKSAALPAKKEAGGAGGTKRKLPLSANNSYYGPSSSGDAAQQQQQPQKQRKTIFFGSGEEDYVPLALNQALGAKNKKEKKEKKKLKKISKKAASSPAKKMENIGFDANEARLSQRSQRFQGRGGILSAAVAKTTAEGVEKYMGKATIGGSKKQLNEVDYERMTVKGTCQVLEKDYLRLTSPPRAELVRPEPVLRRHLKALKRSYHGGGKVHGGRARDYLWYCSQFKALRQDLTVQRIANSFAVDVYETHARVALEEDDINEYNQSQTQLKELYERIDNGDGGGKHRKGKGKQRKEREEDRREALKNRNEFIAYRIIYYVFLSGNRKYDGGSSDIFKIMLQLTPEQRKDESIHHALLVRAAVADNDYHKFFQLQDVAPNMSDYLMDKIVPAVRQRALQCICKAYRPSVSANFVLKELGFDVENRKEAEGGRAWMEGCGCRFEGGVLLTKDTVLKEGVVGVKNSLI